RYARPRHRGCRPCFRTWSGQRIRMPNHSVSGTICAPTTRADVHIRSVEDMHDHRDHGHAHGTIDPSIATSERGIWAIKWSFAGLALTALLQIIVVLLSHSVALLADTI